MHPLLERQIRRITSHKGIADYERLLGLVDLTYSEHDRVRRLQERASQLMSDELSAANAAIRKERDETVAASQKRFELAVEGANDGIWDWDITGNTLWFSARCKAILGYSAVDLSGGGIEKWYELVEKNELPRAQQFIEDNVNRGEGNVVTLRFYHRLGGSRYIMCRVSALRDSSGKVARLIGAHTDISDIILMQEELKEARNRAEKASQSKSDFLANMSHEIRTPMNSIMGMTNLLLGTSLDKQQRLWAEIARHSSESLLDIINDILDISKIEAGKLMLENIPFSLADAITQARATLLFKAEEKNIRLLISPPPDIAKWVIGDPGRIRQILINLIGNAIKFTQQGQVSIRVRAGESSEGKITLHFEVEDTGIGIPADKVAYIFEKFSQAEESTTRKFGGTGLGLAICKTLVQMMGGTISVKSIPGQGSTFTFTLMLQQADEKEDAMSSASSSQQMDFSHAKVLIAEDIKANQIYLKALLAKHHCASEIAQNGTEVLQRTATEKYDIIFMDCQMPEMDGFEATRAIRMLPLSHQPIIIALTAGAMQGDRERCLAAGMDDYLNKPVKAENILAMLRQYAGKTQP